MMALATRRTQDLYRFLSCKRAFSSSSLWQNHYETLGVPRTATSGQIKTSFYRLSQQYHPDVNKDPGAREKFQKVSGAWAVLKDGRERREYDKSLREEGGAGSGPSAWYPSSQSTEWPSYTRRHTRQSAEWAWTYSSRTSAGNSAFRRPHRDPFSNPHVQRATGKAHAEGSTSSSESWYADSGTYYYGPSGRGRRKSAASARAEQEHMREAEANSQAGLWNTFPTIGVTLIFMFLAHGWGVKA